LAVGHVETGHHDIDRVSRFLRILAFGLAVIGIAFGALDRLELLPPLAVAATPSAGAQHASHSPEAPVITPWLSAGELLKQFDERGADRSKSSGSDVSARPSQKQIADQAGISKRQRDTAVRVGNVPLAGFDAAIEVYTVAGFETYATPDAVAAPQRDGDFVGAAFET
jgi:hypothetical protein